MGIHLHRPDLIAKGDLLSASASSTLSILSVGTDGQVLTADSTQTTGLKYASAMAIGGSITSGTSGSVLYVNSSNQLAQDNANFFWDATNKRLGIGAAPSWTIHATTATGGGDKRVQLTVTGTHQAGNTYSFYAISSVGVAQFGIDRYFNTLGAAFISTTSVGGMIFSGDNNNQHFNVFANGNVGFGVAGVDGSAQLQVTSSTSTKIAAFIRGATSQSANLQEWQKNDATILSKVNAAGNVGIRMGTTTLTALLHIAAGTASASTAPLKFTMAGSVILTTPESGAMETDTDNIYLTKKTAVRESIPGVLFTATASATVTNTVTETSIIGAGVGTLTLPANFFVAGKSIRLRVGGIYSTPLAATPSVTVKVKLGSTVIATVTTTSLLSGASNLEFDGEVFITCRTTGASGTVMVHGDIEYATGVAGTIAVDSLNNAGAITTVDTTASKLLDVTITWDSATSSRTATGTVCEAEVLN